VRIQLVLIEVLLACGTLGCLFMIVAACVAFKFVRHKEPAPRSASAVTILKPLHGDEPGLFDNLASFCIQDYPGPVQIIFGVANPHDAAIGVVERLLVAFPSRSIEFVVDGRIAGSNPKVSNLINMSPRIRHDIVVIADSDIRVRPDYLSCVVGALEESGSGAVTCPYVGTATGNVWSQLARLHIDSHFLPSVIVSARFKLAQPCLGSTIALRRTSLAAIGGFETVANCLADDHELGKSLIARGEPVSLLPVIVAHMCNEPSWRELLRHELRWVLTIRTIAPLGYLGWTVNHAFPLALAAFAIGGGLPALALALLALACRAAILVGIERGSGLSPHPYWLIPLRDLLSFMIFTAGFIASGVDWKGRRYRLVSKSKLVLDQRSPLS
jgi:ceramide glucosyltransferase